MEIISERQEGDREGEEGEQKIFSLPFFLVNEKKKMEKVHQRVGGEKEKEKKDDCE